MVNLEELEKVKKKALEDHIPIIMDDTLEVIKKILEEESNKRNTISGRFVDAEPYPKIYEEIKHKIEEIMRMEEKYSSNLSKSDKKKAIIKAIEESGITGENINKAEQMLGVEDKENKITHADSE